MTRGLPPARHVLLVAIGGALGAVLRVAFVQAFPTEPGAIPWVTLLENVTGAFLLAVLLTALGRRITPDPNVRLLLGTGVLGSFTTYSAHSVELVVLLDAGKLPTAAVYLALTIGGGLVAAGAGVLLGRRLVVPAEHRHGRRRR